MAEYPDCAFCGAPVEPGDAGDNLILRDPRGGERIDLHTRCYLDYTITMLGIDDALRTVYLSLFDQRYRVRVNPVNGEAIVPLAE